MSFFLSETALALQLLVQQHVWVDPADLICMSRNIYHEARGESLKGQIAVGFVTLNRVEDTEHESTICEVVYAPGQFSWTETERSQTDAEAYETAMNVAIAVMSGQLPDPTHGATYFYNAASRPAWAQKFTEVAHIGAHRFLLE